MNRFSQRTRSFWLAFSITFFAMAVVCMLVILKVTPPSLQTPQEETPRQAVYYPSEQEDLTLLHVLLQDGELQEMLLIGFYPGRGQIPLLVLPGETVLTCSQGEMSAQECYVQEGVKGLMEGIQRTLAVSIDRYLLCEETVFAQLYNQFSPIEFSVPCPVTIEKDGIQAEIPEGTQPVDGDQLVRLANYDGYPGGESQRLQVLGELVAAEINQNLMTQDPEEADEHFKTIVNTVETDLAYGDFQIRKEALAFLVALGTDPAQVIPLSGHWNDQEGTFYLEEEMGSLVLETYGSS